MASKSRFEELVVPHMQAAFTLAYWILHSREEAEDVVQDAYVRAFRAFDSFRGESVKPWLLAIVRNAAYRATQKRRRTASVMLFSEDLKGKDRDSLGEMASLDPSPERILISEEERRLLLAALSGLPVDYREVIVLRELEGLSYNEIAEAIEAPIGTVMSRLSRARAELRRALAERMGGGHSDAV
jgi:RNA polymerase sigma-70 factor (ECF subfamily)